MHGSHRLYGFVASNRTGRKIADSLVLVKNPNAKYPLLDDLGLKELKVEYDGLKIGYRIVESH